MKLVLLSALECRGGRVPTALSPRMVFDSLVQLGWAPPARALEQPRNCQGRHWLRGQHCILHPHCPEVDGQPWGNLCCRLPTLQVLRHTQAFFSRRPAWEDLGVGML